RGADLVQRDASEQRLHVLQRGDGHAHLAHLATSHDGVGVMTHLGRQVESDRKASLALPEQVAETTIRLSRAPEASVLPDGPGPTAVHLGIDTTGEGGLP